MTHINPKLPMAKVTIKQMVFKPITMSFTEPQKCNYCSQVRKAGGFIAHVPLLEGTKITRCIFTCVPRPALSFNPCFNGSLSRSEIDFDHL